MNYDSIKNQDIKRKFVEREIMACVSSMVEYIISKSYEETDKNIPFTYDDIENMYVPKCPNCGDTNSMKETENEDGETIYKCSYCEHEQNTEFETEPQEVFEWWLVTDWLGDKLADKKEVVIREGNNTIWGRCCTGQAILLDGVISEICEEMGILEGQEHEWKV